MKLVIKNGLVDGIYYENNKPKSYAGLIFVDGSYYYIADYGKMIKGRSYAIVNTNGLTLPDGTLIPKGTYEFDEDGKMKLVIKNGLVDGIYYENNKPVWGLINLNGDFYYIFGPNKFITDKAFHVENTNGLTFPDGTPIPKGTYSFDSEGRMILKNGLVDGVYYENNAPKANIGVICQDGKYYYIAANGKPVTGCRYFVTKTNGLVLKGWYHFDVNGVMIRPVV